MLKSFLGLSVLSRGQNVPNIYQGVVCCYECFFFWLGVGGGVLTWPETSPLLGHHHEVHHFYKSAEPVLGDRT